MEERIKLDLIDADKEQPRQTFISSEMHELIESIRVQGILNPLHVEKDYADNNGRYLLLDGERRYRSAKQLELEEVPVVVIQGPLSFEERTIYRFHIQSTSKDWSFFDKARALAMLKQRAGLTLAEIGEKLQMQAPMVHALISVADFTDAGQKLILEKKIRFTYLITLIRAVKRYVELTQRSQYDIELPLIQRLAHGKFGTIPEMNKFSQILFNDSHLAEKIRFLDDESYSLSNFFIDTGAAEVIVSTEIHTQATKLTRALSNLRSETLSRGARLALEKLAEILHESLYTQ